MQAQFNKVTELYNYGCPRVGNEAFANYVNSVIPTRYRVVADYDIVPQVPLKVMNYKHNSNEVYFTDKMTKWRVCDDSGEDPTCENSVPMTLFNAGDHFRYAELDFLCIPR